MSEPDVGRQGASQKRKRGSRLGRSALVLGIIGIVLAFFPIMSIVGIILGAIAVILAGIGLLRKRPRMLVGSVLAVVALVLGIIFTSIYAPVLGSVSTTAENAATTPAVTVAPAAPASSAPSTPTSTPTKTKPSTPAATVSQMQALAAAKNYLSDGQGFSEKSLTQQLTAKVANGFDEADAEWAVAHSGADWNAQAVMAAKNYMSDGQGFSRTSLIQQLTSSFGNGFTEAQAEYAVDKVGLK